MRTSIWEFCKPIPVNKYEAYHSKILFFLFHNKKKFVGLYDQIFDLGWWVQSFGLVTSKSLFHIKFLRWGCFSNLNRFWTERNFWLEIWLYLLFLTHHMSVFRESSNAPIKTALTVILNIIYSKVHFFQAKFNKILKSEALILNQYLKFYQTRNFQIFL